MFAHQRKAVKKWFKVNLFILFVLIITHFQVLSKRFILLIC